jgi:hypothetical protein
MKVSIICMFMLVISIFLGGYLHEQVHVKIYRDYNISSHVDYWGDFPNFITYPEKRCDNPNCILANELNEIVGYPLMVILSSLGFLLVVIIVFLEYKYWLNELNREK